MTFSLDASAALCWARRERGVDRVAEVLDDPDTLVTIHIVNLIEVRYHLLRRDRRVTNQTLAQLESAGVIVHSEISEPMAALAAEIKANFAPVSLADAICFAHAATTGAVLLTTDVVRWRSSRASARSSSCAERLGACLFSANRHMTVRDRPHLRAEKASIRGEAETQDPRVRNISE